MKSPHVLLYALVAGCAAGSPQSMLANDPFAEDVAPYIQKYCVECHSGDDAKGELNFDKFRSSADVVGSFRRWQNVIKFIRSGEMPPEKSPQPEIADSNAVVQRVEAILVTAATERAGDPGVVLPRRLSNTEYDQSVSDLTGVALQVTRDFPPDPAAGEGFDNTGEALGMSPNLLKKYLAAADAVAQHLVLKPDGMTFAPHPVSSYNERKKLTEQAIIDFYEARAVDTEAYLDAAWRYQHRDAADQSASISQWAARQGLSPQYLGLVWETLTTAPSDAPFWQQFLAMWKNLPGPSSDSARPPAWGQVRRQFEFAQKLFTTPRQQLIRSNAGNWPISHLDFRAQTAASRDQFDASRLIHSTVLNAGRIPTPNDKQPAKAYSIFVYIDPAFSTAPQHVHVEQPIFTKADQLPQNANDEQKHAVQTLRSVWEQARPDLAQQWKFGQGIEGGEIDADSFVVTAPAVIEIPISVAMHEELQGKQLLVPIRLDAQHSQQGSVLVRHARSELAERNLGPDVTCLVHRDSDLGRELAASGAQFCRAFPNRFFYVDERRGLAAGFHLVEGFFRDDRPLVEKVLSEAEKQELDQLWRELEFVTQSYETLLRGFVWFERSERHVLHDKRFDFLRPEDPALVEAAILDRFEKLYLDKLGIPRVGDTLTAQNPDDRYTMVHGFFERIRAGLAQQLDTMNKAEKRALVQIEKLAQRAYRRQLTTKERDSLLTLYRNFRSADRTVEQSLRGVMTAIVMSPRFFYRYREAAEGTQRVALSDDALASRLSYFLWSSIPDAPLLDSAAAGALQRDEEMVAQTRRMLQDPRVRNFAREFFGQWLRYRDYLAKDPIHAPAFAEYDEPLRQAMSEEPTRLATHLIRENGSVLRLLNSDTTFVNARLAKHYGGAIEKAYRHQVSAGKRTDHDWLAVGGLQAAGRGGLFGMAVILTKASAGARTSPVKRGFWTVHHLLGQHFPPPPADVPELPETEQGADRTIRDLLSAHVADAQCALCHKHFDSLGLAMEGFDPIGRQRTHDAAGRPIDSLATLPGGETAAGIPALIEYIERERRDDFVRTLCRKFLGYALGRSVMLSDQPLLDEMATQLKNHDYRFATLFETVVLSPQFRQQRGGNEK